MLRVVKVDILVLDFAKLCLDFLHSYLAGFAVPDAVADLTESVLGVFHIMLERITEFHGFDAGHIGHNRRAAVLKDKVFTDLFDC